MVYLLVFIRSLLLMIVTAFRLPAILSTLLFSEFSLIIASIVGWFRTQGEKLLIRYLYWSIGLVLIMQCLIFLGLFRQSDLKLADAKISWPDTELRRYPIRILPVSIENASAENLKTLYRNIVDQLEKVGAKAIVLERGFSYLYDNEADRENHRTVIHTVDYPYFYADFDLPTACYTLDLGQRSSGILHTITPQLLQYPSYDITIELLRKYHHYPEEMTIIRKGNTVNFGEYQIPVHSDGRFYLRLDPVVMPPYSEIVPVQLIEKGNRLLYFTYGSGTASVDSTQNILVNKHAGFYKEKIVFVNLSTPVTHNISETMTLMLNTINAFHEVLQKRYFTQSGWVHLLLLAVTLLLFALICSVIRPFYAFSILIVLFTGSFYFVQWLLHTQQIFIQMTAYHLVTLLAVVIFPVLRFVHDLEKTGKV